MNQQVCSSVLPEMYINKKQIEREIATSEILTLCYSSFVFLSQ